MSFGNLGKGHYDPTWWSLQSVSRLLTQLSVIIGNTTHLRFVGQPIGSFSTSLFHTSWQNFWHSWNSVKVLNMRGKEIERLTPNQFLIPNTWWSWSSQKTQLVDSFRRQWRLERWEYTTDFMEGSRQRKRSEPLNAECWTFCIRMVLHSASIKQWTARWNTYHFGKSCPCRSNNFDPFWFPSETHANFLNEAKPK